MTWSLAWGEVEKHQNLPVPHPSGGACSPRLVPLKVPAESISSAVLLPTSGGFGYKFIFIKKKKSFYTVFCCSCLLCNVFLFWEMEQRWLQLFLAGEGVWMRVPAARGGHGAACLRVVRVRLPSEGVGFFAFLWLFHFISIADLILNQI